MPDLREEMIALANEIEFVSKKREIPIKQALRIVLGDDILNAIMDPFLRGYKTFRNNFLPKISLEKDEKISIMAMSYLSLKGEGRNSLLFLITEEAEFSYLIYDIRIIPFDEKGRIKCRDEGRIIDSREFFKISESIGYRKFFLFFQVREIILPIIEGSAMKVSRNGDMRIIAPDEKFSGYILMADKISF
jgi:hypothetical protein